MSRYLSFADWLGDVQAGTDEQDKQQLGTLLPSILEDMDALTRSRPPLQDLKIPVSYIIYHEICYLVSNLSVAIAIPWIQSVTRVLALPSGLKNIYLPRLPLQTTRCIYQ
jgi:hypothetical protein